jgi:hypothetical protein
VLIDCKSIIEFPFLPPNLKELTISNCNQINFIGSDDLLLKGIGFHGRIPTLLKNINLVDLKDLTWTGELPSNLESLLLNNCNKVTVSSLPKHLKGLAIEFLRF